ncbi:MAG: 2-dehydropantoate 2-reductase [Armatimonadota bacterium]|nr:2-dehydropantoate 2-reductase [Armatimonadota bacterium]MDR7548830.1 2-dehydropantoate 2-reductase [Armatimonadota bacterium]
MNITVVGAGGLGGYFGGLLARSGHRVTFVARGAHLEALRRQGGIRLKTVHGEFFAPAEAAEAPPQAPAPDLVLFTVKSFDTAAAAEALRPAVGPEAVVLSLQNGVDNEEHLARLFGPERVLGGVVYMLSTIQEPGVVQQTGGPRTLTFGEWRGGLSDRVRYWERLMNEAGILATASEDVVREKWVKFAFICALAGMTALTRLPIGEIRACPPSWEMFRQILEEVVAVGGARGVRLGRDVVEAHLALAQRVEPHMTSSLHYDLIHGKRLEVEALHGTVVRYGREAGVPTPACEAVYAALLPHHQRAERAGTPPPT